MFGSRSRFFRDRREAGTRLAKVLGHLKEERPIVLALPRGGVPVAFEVAKALAAPLDVLLVRKLGAPGHPEYGIGAVVDGPEPQLVLNDGVVSVVQPSEDYIREEMLRQLAEIERRRNRYSAGYRGERVTGRTVIVIDDGIATGGTVRAALKALRRAGARRIVLAVPVAPPDTVETIRAEGDADEVICLETPTDFRAVGLHYADFEQTSDEEVIGLLQAAAAWTAVAE
jgi:putative phosphoribosyl transferase